MEETDLISFVIYAMVIMIAANSLQNKAYRIILSQWGSIDKVLWVCEGDLMCREGL